MYRQIHAGVLMLAFLLTAMCALAQDTSQTIPVTPPPSRRIEPPPANATPQDLDERGDQLRAEKAYLDAMDYFQAALKKIDGKDPFAAQLYNKIGITQLQLTRYTDARKSFQKSIKIDKTFSKSYNNLGVVYYHDKKYGRAIKYYKRALEMESDNASYHSNLGSAYFARKDMNNAVVEYTRAMQLDPEIFDRRSSVGIVAQMSSPEDRAHFSYVIAKMYAQAGQFDRSLLYLRRAMEEGYKDIKNVYQDEEFAKLRKDERFTALMSQPPPAIP
ncbi:MAG: tetratricopeptide repeat protein [Terriglobales bacterium]